MQNTEKTLINFRIPRDLCNTFDHICELQALNRTSVLLRLMREYIKDQKYLTETQPHLTHSEFSGISIIDKSSRSKIRRNKHEINFEENEFLFPIIDRGY